jgi:short-subunit dehydrogenase
VSKPGKGAALVTGASRGIGRAICTRLAREGYDVIAVARNAQELAELCAEITGAGGRCRSITLDLTDFAAVARALDGLEVDVLVNNAGMGVIKPFPELSADEWHAMIDLNVNALFHVTRAVLPGMMKRGRGDVCTIGSIGGRTSWAGGSTYGATKAFVNSWSESLMLEVRDSGVRVSVIQPGSVTTHFAGHTPSASDSWKLTGDDVAEAVAHVLGLPSRVLVHRLEIRTNTVPRRK